MSLHLKKRVYVADDNTQFANYVATVARRNGWAAKVCEDGEKLLQLLQDEDEPALLFIDINMPNMDGIEAAEHIARLDRSLRVRFVTGGLDAPILAAKLIATARDLPVGKNLYKPLSRELLTRILNEEFAALTNLLNGNDPKTTTH